MSLPLLEDLRKRGFSLIVIGENLMVTPTANLTDTVRTLIRENKQAILQALASPTETSSAPLASSAPTEKCEMAPRKPDPSRGKVCIQNHRGSMRWQSSGLPIPDDCYSWCQVNDSVWTYTGNPSERSA